MPSPAGPTDGSAAADRSLIQAVIAGEPGARDSFARRYRPWIVGFASSRFRISEADAEDLFQDVMVRLWQDDLRALRAWRGEGRFSTYLTVITSRLGIARGRDAARTDSAEAADDAEFQDPSQRPEPTTDDRLLADERCGAVRSAMTHLSGRDRLVLTLHYRDGKPFDQIGSLLGLSAGTARKAAFDARRRLRDVLLEHHAELFASESES